MKVRCKSLLVVGRYTVDFVATSTMTRKTERVTYDMNSVCAHEFDLPVRTNPKLLLRFPAQGCSCTAALASFLAGAVVVVLLGCEFVGWRIGAPFAKWTEDHWPTNLFVTLGILAVIGAVLGWLSSTGTVKKELMEAEVRKERRLTKDVDLKVVEEKDWDKFLAGLKQ